MTIITKNNHRLTHWLKITYHHDDSQDMIPVYGNETSNQVIKQEQQELESLGKPTGLTWQVIES